MPLMVGNLINQIDREKSSTALSNCPLMLACYNHYGSAIFGANQQMHQAGLTVMLIQFLLQTIVVSSPRFALVDVFYHPSPRSNC